MSSTKPMTAGEIQLFKVLQRANLLSYYESFISQGGDDVQQLCEAGEEEFLEIMALVGMACKPLHVRRLQKSLQEWVTQPNLFRSSNPNTSGGTAYVSRSQNGNNVFKLGNSGCKRYYERTPKGNKTTEKEMNDDGYTSILVDSLVQRFSSSQMMSSKEVLRRLQADRSLKDIATAVSNDDRSNLESLFAEYIKKNMIVGAHSSGRHETLVHGAAVKLCMADHGFVLKKSELRATAEKIACEVESKLSRRSSIRLHGSTNQSHVQELTKTLQNIQRQKQSLEKRLEEARGNKNAIQENEFQNTLDRLAGEELSVRDERRDLLEKVLEESRDISDTAPESVSSCLAGWDSLAKAHNLSLGNLQSQPASKKQGEKRPRAHSPASQTTSPDCDAERTPPRTAEGDDGSPTATHGVWYGKRKMSNGSRDIEGTKKLITASD